MWRIRPRSTPRGRPGRIYDKHGFLDDAHDYYARAASSGALSPAELEDARFGLAWTAWLGRRADAELEGDGPREIFAVKSYSTPSPCLFDDDPFLGASGPMVLRLTVAWLRHRHHYLADVLATFDQCMGCPHALQRKDV